MTELIKNLGADSIQFGSKTIEYSIVRSARKTLAISVYPNLRVVAVSPVNATREAIQNKIKKRASWIIKQQVFFSDFLPGKPTRQLLHGATLHYLGKQYRLKVQKGLTETVQLKGKYLSVALTASADEEKTKSLIDAWYQERASAHFNRRINLWWPKIASGKTAVPKMTVKHMKKRWGSFTKSGRIILNTELIEAPSQCIDYVVAHELCHAIHQNHSRAFFKLLEKVLPDWQKRKERLEKF